MRLKVIKIGGAVIDDSAALHAFLADFAKIAGPKILVHGGGRAASALCRRLDIPVQMVDGRRITDRDTLDVAVMVYAGLINKQIVAVLQSLGCNAIGLSGADGNAVVADKRPAKPVDYGFVGDVRRVDAESFDCLIRGGLTPVACPITHDGKGHLLNTNADTIARSIAEAMACDYDVELTYCFEMPGVLADVDDPTSVIPRITPATYAGLKADGTVGGGMLPKLDNAFGALANGVSAVVIKEAANLLSPTGTVIQLDD